MCEKVKYVKKIPPLHVQIQSLNHLLSVKNKIMGYNQESLENSSLLSHKSKTALSELCTTTSESLVSLIPQYYIKCYTQKRHGEG